MSLKSNAYSTPDILYRCLFVFLACSIGFIACKDKTGLPQPPKNTAQVAKIMDKANDLLIKGQTQASILYIDSAYAKLADVDIYDKLSKYNYKVYYYLYYDKKPLQATLYADSMLYSLKGKESEYKTEYANAIFSKGDVLMAEKKYTEAFKRYFDAKTFADKNLDKCSSSRLDYRLGLVRYSQESYLKAIPYFKLAFEENKDCNTDAGFENLFVFPQSQLNTIALCYERSNQIDSAIYYYKKALDFVNQNATRFANHGKMLEMALGVIYGNLGGAYAASNNYTEAESYLKKSIEINYRDGYDKGDARTAQIKLAKLYLNYSHFEAANELLNLIKKDLDQKLQKGYTKPDIWLKWHKLKWEYFDKTKDIPMAYQYGRQYYDLNDSLNKVNEGLRTADMDQGLKDAEQRYQLIVLTQNNRLKTTYLIAAIVFSAMIILILFMKWRNLNLSKKNVKQLIQLNQTITEKNIQMQNALSALEQSQEENTQMMKVVAHDLRNPVGGITALSNMMLEESHLLEDDRKMLQMIKASGQNSLDMINDLLHLTSKKELNKEPVDLYSLLHYCVDLLRLKAKEKSQKIELNTTHLTLFINREKMWRVISNLIANAIKFSNPGSTIHVRLEKNDDYALITVEDQGIGIPSEMKDKIFNMFTEAKRKGTEGEQTFGMGLAISKQIVEAHSGNIWFESEPGNGTHFYVKLPIAD